jgi:hypothetical protein
MDLSEPWGQAPSGPGEDSQLSGTNPYVFYNGAISPFREEDANPQPVDTTVHKRPIHLGYSKTQQKVPSDLVLVSGPLSHEPV